ncbi:hypothetical protein GGS20DRAFT_548548 [Poronia punctata]|nr:hypothetical protein GGS20DRAFT_548548 [Poronia punctata]
MDFIRSSMLWRGQTQQQQLQPPDLEQQVVIPDSPQVPEPARDLQQETRNNLRSLIVSQPPRSSLFTRGRSSLSWGRGRTNEVVSDENDEYDDDDDVDDGPNKSPAPNRFRLPSLAIPRFSMRNAMSPGQPQPQPPAEDEDIYDIERDARISQQPRALPRPLSGIRRLSILALPRTARTTGERPPEQETHENADRPRRGARTRFNGSSPVDLRLTGLAETEGRRQRRQQRRRRRRDNSNSSSSTSGSRGHRKGRPKRFLFCFPWNRSRRARSLILRCFVLGLFLVLMLIIYLSLAMTKNIETSEFTILLIVLILLTTIIFCHGLIRLCMLLAAQRNRKKASPGGVAAAEVNAVNGPQGGYVVPREPIRVVLASDEEAAGIESEAVKTTPPAYGKWRESVRVDPNRIYWQRAEPPKPQPSTATPTDMNGDANDEHAHGAPHEQQLRRPPSYASDDGVEYVVDARPRSIAPPPSSVYSQPSMVGTPALSYYGHEEIPPMPSQLHPALTRSARPLVAGTPGNWAIMV